ncbi:Sodium:solute symporter family protein [Amycolatopsis xylanica]|uniref:Sodium:solute symporter family protein n=1 Tax=Amycolatopsis xylanica TaxID=589385 RepID=A0A1H3B543_9PSEU|nr:cation acetate symporter [Amycolatopsis xylanica]SDX37076.1 Sodium:solute symporter family protein [Amycolatopsis xylanica]
MQLNPWALTGIVLVAVATFYLGHRSSRFAVTTHDFLVARRTVRSRRNAAAISGEYLSAASFLGVAGIVLKEGADALWFPIGFTAGYLALMLFVAAPLRRSGAYTLPDFVEARLGSKSLRKFSTAFVVFIGILYMVPQLQGAGLTLATILPVPPWFGAVLVMFLVAFNVIAGGMRAITVVQAFQYWLKLFAIAAPTFVLCLVFVTGGSPGGTRGLGDPAPPVFLENTTVTVQADVMVSVTTRTTLEAHGTVDRGPADGEAIWAPDIKHSVAEGTRLVFKKGTPVPVISDAPTTNANWLRPSSGSGTDLAQTYSLIFALFLGTMGLPHVLVRFYTNPDGKAARRTTVHVLLLLGLFYLFPTLLGALSRMYVPELLVTGKTDAAVLRLPSAMLPGLPGQILGAVTAAGAFAAFLSSSSGLLVSVAGVVSTDVLPGRVRDFRVATGIVAIAPMALAVLLRPEDISLSVGMSFALAASTFSPLLVLGIWWRKLSWPGAMAGMVVGGGMVLAALVVNIVSGYTGGWAPWFAVQPALITVPSAFFTCWFVSRATKYGVPDDLNSVMLRLHAPDPLGFMRDRAVARFGQAEEKHDKAEKAEKVEKAKPATRGRHRK